MPGAVPPPAARPARPAERLPAGPLLLRRMRPEDAGEIAAAVGASLDHLRPWMPWATPEAAQQRTQLIRITEADELWDSGSDYIYVIFARGGGDPGLAPGPDGTLVGTIGLHRRIGEGAIEIGYWIAATQTRRGYGTEAARALTHEAAALPGIRRVEIHCDEANTASAGIPRKIGYRLDRIEPHEPEAPGECGRRMIWVWDTQGGAAGGAW